MRLLPILFALIGCSTTRAVSLPLAPPDIASINDEVKEKGAAIQLRKEPCCRGGEDVVVSSDAIEWTDEAKRGQRVRAPPEAVERITVRYHGHGALAGAGVGLATGVVLGVVVAAGVHGEETAEGYLTDVPRGKIARTQSSCSRSRGMTCE